MPRADSLCVLVVDDDVLLRELVSARLRAGGCIVIEAGTGEQAAAVLLAGANPDILVTDIAMPNSMSGWFLGEQSRTLRPAIPIIYTSSGAPDPARMVTNSRFIQKPYHPDELVLAIRQLSSSEAASDPSIGGAPDVLT